MGLGDWLSSLFGKGEDDEAARTEPAVGEEAGREEKSAPREPESPPRDRDEGPGTDF